MPSTATERGGERRCKTPLIVWVFAYILAGLYLLMLIGTIPGSSMIMDDEPCDPSYQVCVSLANYYAEHWYLIFLGFLNVMFFIIAAGILFIVFGGLVWAIGCIVTGECKRECSKCDCSCDASDLTCCIYCCSPHEQIN